MPTNDFLPFGSAVGANVMSQADYLALTARLNGFSAGTANSAQLNKAWRQSSIAAAVIGQFIANRSGQNAVDDGTTATLLTNLELAINGLSQIGSGTYAADGGTANAHTAAFNPPITALTDGMVLKYKASVANTGACTFNPNGLGAKPLVGFGHSALQGGEIVVNSDVWVQYNSSIGSGSWILIDSSGGALQVAPATQSQHAMQLGQATGRLIGVQRFITGTSTYTPTPGTTAVVVELVGGGASGGGAGTTAAGQVSLGSGGGAGGYTKGRLTSGFSGASVVIGAGGAQSSSAGVGGGTTSFGGTLVAGGGVGGAIFTATGTYPILALGGLGGSASGGTIVSQDGGQGGSGIAFTSTNMASGTGGMSAFGAGGGSVTGSASGLNANGFGAGGGGGSNNNGGSVRASGAGSGGLAIVWEYA